MCWHPRPLRSGYPCAAGRAGAHPGPDRPPTGRRPSPGPSSTGAGCRPFADEQPGLGLVLGVGDQVLLNVLSQALREDDGPQTRPRIRALDHQTAAHLRDRPAHRQPHRLQVDVAAPQPHQLTPPERAVHRQEHDQAGIGARSPPRAAPPGGEDRPLRADLRPRALDAARFRRITSSSTAVARIDPSSRYAFAMVDAPTAAS